MTDQDFEIRPPARPAALRAALARIVAELVRVRARLVAHTDRLDSLQTAGQNLAAKANKTDAVIDGLLVPIIGPANVKTRLTALYAAGKVPPAQLAEAVARGWITQAEADTITGVAP